MLYLLLLTSLLMLIAFMFAAVLFKICLKLAVYIGPLCLALLNYDHSNYGYATIWLVVQFALWAILIDNDKIHPPLA